MKKSRLFKGLVLGVMLTFMLGVSAQKKAQLKINKYLETSYSVVTVGNPSQKTAHLTIKNTNGDVIFKKMFLKNAFSSKLFSLANLNDGKYTATLTGKGLEPTKKEFAIINNKISDATIMSKSELKAFFRLNDNILYVSHIAFGANTFGISIEDAIGDEVFKKGFKGNSIYTGKFDISTLPNGDYSVKIKSGKKQYSYAFTK